MKQQSNKFFDRINESAYDNFGGNNYDPNYFEDVTNGYDPNYAGEAAAGAATKTEASRPGQSMQINLTLSNPTASKQKMEIFSPLYSWANVYKSNYVVGAYACIPALSTEGLATIGVGTIGFDQNGDLRKYGAAMAASAVIGCGEYPYISLQESIKSLPFRVTFLRIAVQTTAQLNNQIVHFTQTFAGGYKSNRINVRSYKKPTQFQNLEVDTATPFVVDGEKGLEYSLEIGEVVQIGMFINRWARPTV